MSPYEKTDNLQKIYEIPVRNIFLDSKGSCLLIFLNDYECSLITWKINSCKGSRKDLNDRLHQGSCPGKGINSIKILVSPLLSQGHYIKSSCLSSIVI